MNPIIRVRGLSKQYRIGARRARYGSLRDSLVSAVSAPLDALRRLREERPTIWALKDVSFDVMPGEVVGIIGRNGAGKSTLLKILTRITGPTEGEADLFGRVASLLEVGTGFHPELTGRDNIFLNGAILGMHRAEIVRKLDEIVAFAEIDQFIDTPVKHYSSGMYVRLAFAVAAHLDPEILLVDEVLAVGDAGFQKKCLGKMGEVAQGGRTVLFVSHNMGAISRLCGKALWLDAGRLHTLGAAAEVIADYSGSGRTDRAEERWPVGACPGDDTARLIAVRICQGGPEPVNRLDASKPIEVQIELEILQPFRELALGLRINRDDGEVVLHTSDALSGQPLSRSPGPLVLTCCLPPHALNEGKYSLSLGADVPFVRMVFVEEDVLRWQVARAEEQTSRYGRTWLGVLGPGLVAWTSATATLQSPPRQD